MHLNEPVSFTDFLLAGLILRKDKADRMNICCPIDIRQIVLYGLSVIHMHKIKLIQISNLEDKYCRFMILI